MAKETFEKLVDDLDGSDATETVNFGMDGHQYHIDLNDAHARTLRDLLAPYVARAEKVRVSRPRRKTPAGGKERNQAIRAWARTAGVDLPWRGRIAGTVQAAFDAQDTIALHSALGLEPPTESKRTRKTATPRTRPT